MPIEIDPRLHDPLREHALRARPREACGLLARDDRARFVSYAPMVNLARDPGHFVMDPIAVVRVAAAFRSDGLELGGVFHSHPDGRAVPSAADEAAAWGELVQWIARVDAADSFELTAWRHVEGRLHQARWVTTIAIGAEA